jgi:hypothetical protein
VLIDRARRQALAVTFMLIAGPGLAQDTGRKLPPGAVPAGSGNPYARARQLPARILQFGAEPSAVRPGAPVLLEWATENPLQVTIEPGIGRATARGSRQVFPTSTTTYKLTVQGPNNQTLTKEVTVSVSGPPVSSKESQAAASHPDLSGVYDFSMRAQTPIAVAAAGNEAPVLKPGAEKFKIVRGPNDAGPTADCMPLAGPQAFAVPYQFQIVQGRDYIVLMHEYPGTFRIIPTTGVPHQKDLDPTWLGDSVGHWEGDTLVVDTIGFNDRTEISGYRHTEDMHLVERFHRAQNGGLEYEATIEDPNVFEKPWKITRVYPPRPDLTKIGEFVCEANRDYSGLFKKEGKQ